ncbi:Rab GTPase-binding exocyst subunit S15 [Elasticomyces elasticus]|uniref:Exocyst complex component SEC15 n=1 Tax=Exophiala sideris TaxID=1016849 RepID=A0ABR0JKU9_9EURO|nr:Rab GTPase-binding exocyst subunit S15 [Elasticomyces elasticus]KAK5032141.1 Rab GTPase-binding exocyst subunit S15 [Exophiala sideris]KAK5036139.1 Rab GTPase-binding exocyst subunit S15 [Exophiala sideris]KAK5066522.1 Rab GTPase-binding exocyst subunit S15 [Exophiala sideris]KAK5180344.1 Rab GTPase-binding exocyst subunit S15 [Eurotiomycetes sp. CCFEE 6388]
MPSIAPYRADTNSVLQQIVTSSSETDTLDQLIPYIKDYSYGNKTSQLLSQLDDLAAEREAEIERQCNANHQEFVKSVQQLLRIREGTVTLTNEILELNQSIQASTENLVEQKKALVESRGVRQNIDDASHALQDCLEVLRLANQVQELRDQKKHYAALRALDELQSVHLQSVTQYKLSELIQTSVPAIQKSIAEAVMADLNTWLFRVREMSQYLGELSFYHTDLRQQRLTERADKNSYLANFKLNSAIELVADEHEEFDLLKSEDLEVDFSPLFEALHIHRSLGRMDRFKADYATSRRAQSELLLQNSISLVDEELGDLHSLLEDTAGFAIMERATRKRVPDLRSNTDIEELWDSLCQKGISLMSKALSAVDNAEHLLNIKNLISLFTLTMNSFNFNTSAVSNFVLVLFDNYAELLKQRFSEDFIEIVSTDDYMPMPIQNAEEFEKVVNVSWYTPDRPVHEMTFPTVFPFSQMYPLCCIDIRNFLNQFYFFSAQEEAPSPLSSKIDAQLLTSLDDLLTTKVCASLVSKLSSQYLGQIVQILINLSHFTTACRELETLLATVRTSTLASGGPPISLRATAQFSHHQKTAENRIFELVNMKVSDLIETAEYDWLSRQQPTEPSNYIVTLTRYLSNIINSVLLSLPSSLKDLMLFNAISHTASAILALPLAPNVERITTTSIAQLSMDVSHFQAYVETLPNNSILMESLDELIQTVALMATDQPDEFYDISLRNKKYRNVDPLKGPQLLEKVVHVEVRRFTVGPGGHDRGSSAANGGTQSPVPGQQGSRAPNTTFAALQNRFMHNR